MSDRIHVWTEANNGTPCPLDAKQVVNVKEFPAGQTWVDYTGGTFYQLKESVADVLKWWQENAG
jgi:hypothetical protein